MKKAVFSVLFLTVLIGLYGQTQPENKWILGSWAGQSLDRVGNVELTLNDDGTGRYNDFGGNVQQAVDIAYAINGNTLTIFYGRQMVEFAIFRINNHKMVIRQGRLIVELNKPY